MYRETGSKFKGEWQSGIAQGPGQLIHDNHRYRGHWVDGMLHGPGKYIFDIGCEQLGEYVPVEMNAGDGEDDEAASITIPKWKASKWAPIQCD